MPPTTMGTRPRSSTSFVASLASLQNWLAEYSVPMSKETSVSDHTRRDSLSSQSIPSLP